MLNKAILQGRLVADPELNHTQSGTAVISFRIACDRDYKSKDPNAQNVDFITIVAWRKTAEFVGKYFAKGDMVLLEGAIQVRNYTDKDGNKRYATEVVADHINFCGGSKSQGGNRQRGGSYEPSVKYDEPSGSYPSFTELDEDDGDLPR